MAKRVPKPSFLNNILGGANIDINLRLGGVDTPIPNNIFQARILADREFRGFQKTVLDSPSDYDHDLTANRRPELSEQQERILSSRGNSNDIASTGYTSEPANQRQLIIPVSDSISIIDIDYVPETDDASRFYKAVTLPFIPSKLDYSAKSNFVGVPSFGRNNPYYHYMGSEDILKFKIDWFSALNSRRDVIFYCRWLEALTKGDGYTNVPHRIKLSWGEENLLFEDSTWIVTAAPYQLTDFIGSYKKGGVINKVGLLPQQAFQDVVLKRITDHNLTTSEIIGKIKPRLDV